MQNQTNISDLASRISQGAGQVIRGADQTLRLLTTALFCCGHVLLEDLPGTGKTTLVKAIAKLTGCDFKRIQCTPDLMPADLTGYEILHTDADGTRRPVFRKGSVFTNLLLADEINRMAPRSQAGLLECMAEHQVTYNGTRYDLPEPFFVIATQNPIELQGTFPLPEAQLDRFFMRLSLGQPSREQELAILNDRQETDPLDSLSPVTSPKELIEAQALVKTVKISADVCNYLLDLADATRRHSQVRYGLSTRGALALQHAAQGYAAVSGRDYVIPDDVKAVFQPVCAHRIHISNAVLSDEAAAGRLMKELLNSVEVPKA